jgi:pimeloyl-ACP methyl ester carboxylesterase
VARARSGEIEIEYETFGDCCDPALLLVMGLGSQMILWDDEFCQQLAGRGFYVIRYDNRDVGLSAKMRDLAGPCRVLHALITAARGGAIWAPYTLNDMASDGVSVLDALRIPAAHVVGSSMGGMIAQLIAIEHPERVLSLTSISSTTGSAQLPRPPMDVIARFSRPPPLRRRTYVAHAVKVQRMLNGDALPFDEDRARRRSERAFARGVDIGGAMRQFLALLAAPSRETALAGVTAPTLVVHGDADPVSYLDCARATADAVPGAELLIVPGMGHDLVPAVWAPVIEAIARNAGRSPDAGPSPRRAIAAHAPHGDYGFSA